MKTRISTLAFAFLLTFGLTTAQAQEHAHHAADEAPAVQPTLVDGVQVVEIDVTPMGYSIDKISLAAGVPVRLLFTRTKKGGCTDTVQVPAFGVEPVALPLNEAVAIDFTPTESGTFAFACSMDMVKGALLVKADS